jgi:hypothetical protein
MESVPDGSTIVFSVDLGMESLAEMGPGLTALTKYFVDREFKIVVMSYYTDGPVIFTSYVESILTGLGYEEGVDYVNLGYISGLATGYRAMATDIRSVVSNDYSGNPIDSLPIMENVNKAQDFAFVISIDAYNSCNDFVFNWGSPFGTPILGAPTGTCYMVYYPSYAGGLIEGLIGGGRGIAEFEVLIGKPGIGIAGIGALTVAHLILVGFMLLGNVVMIIDRSKEES